jgi:transposase-like protein
MQTKYPDKFKLDVLEEYYASTLGVRSIALKFNLPSKNYINKWEKELIAKGLLPEGATKPNKAAGRSKERVTREDTRTEREVHYEDEIARLKARIDYLESLEHLQPFISKKNGKSGL